MVRVIVQQAFTENTVYAEIAGLSTDTKPTEINDKDIVTGSLFLEVDTMKLFAFDETSSGSWGNGVQLGSGS